MNDRLLHFSRLIVTRLAAWVVLVFAELPRLALAWGEPHLAITRAALDVLPAWQKDALGAELEPLGAKYCMIPDNVHTDKENAKFAMMDSRPGEVYILNLHLPAQQSENLDTMRYFMGRAVAALKAGRVADAARFMGTLSHQIEDYGSPAHTLPGDNMFTLLQQFMPPTERMDGKLLHGPIENGAFAVSIAGYRPAVLGVTVDEAAWRLLHRANEGIINARGTTFPIIQALYAGDSAAVTTHQMKAAVMDAKVLADALHTILCLGANRFEPADRERLQRVGISSFFPIEAASLYYPQSQFFSSPYWGHPSSGFTLEGGTKPVPLRLRVREADRVKERTFREGISVGMGKPLTWHLPEDVYRRFTVLAGLHPELGAKGRAEFTVLGDGKVLATTTVNGSDPAHAFDCDITGVAQLQLSAAGRGLNSRSNYAIWAEPSLGKRPADPGRTTP